MHLIRAKMTKTRRFLRNKEIYVIRSSETLNGYTFINYLLIQSLKSSINPVISDKGFKTNEDYMLEENNTIIRQQGDRKHL